MVRRLKPVEIIRIHDIDLVLVENNVINVKIAELSRELFPSMDLDQDEGEKYRASRNRCYYFDPCTDYMARNMQIFSYACVECPHCPQEMKKNKLPFQTGSGKSSTRKHKKRQR